MIGRDTAVYRRRLPHLSKAHKTYFATFVTRDRAVLPELARTIALASCKHEHQLRCWLHCVVIMPDHAHLLLTPYEGVALFDILGDMKSASSHIANRALHRKGSIWMDESFDYILRNGDDVLKKARYILENPVRKGLVADPLAWPWYWTPYVELFARS